MEHGYRESLPYTRAIGGVAGDLAPLVTMINPAAGFALKATAATTKAYGVGERFLTKHKPAVMPRNGIQAPKPEEAKADVFY